MVGGARELCGVSFVWALIPFTRVLLLWPNHSPKVPFSNTIILGVWILTYEFGKNKYSVHNTGGKTRFHAERERKPERKEGALQWSPKSSWKPETGLGVTFKVKPWVWVKLLREGMWVKKTGPCPDGKDNFWGRILSQEGQLRSRGRWHDGGTEGLGSWGIRSEMKVSDTTSRNRRECLLQDRTWIDTATLEMLCWRRRRKRNTVTDWWNRLYRKGIVLNVALVSLTHLIFKATFTKLPPANPTAKLA